jgi:hypothetical protein
MQFSLLYKKCMKYKTVFIATGLAITALMGTSVKADEAEDLLNQLAATTKSGNSDGSTGNLVKSVLEYYRTYLKQIDSLANEGDSPVVKTPDQNTSPPADTTKSTAAASPASPLQTSHLQTSGLQVTGLQTSGPLKEVHLAGYPALPYSPPTSSLTKPTAAQLQDKARTDWEQTNVQMYYFEHPGRSPN